MTTAQHKPETAKRERISRELHRILDHQASLGTARTISGWFFDQPYIFDPNSRRRPKPEILIVLAYLLFMAAACAAFNFR
jgi:hypothetical protein